MSLAVDEDDAATLLGHLPPGGWGEVATWHDVDQLRTEMHALHQEVAGALTAQTRLVIFTMAGTIALLGSLVIGILGLQ